MPVPADCADHRCDECYVCTFEHVCCKNDLAKRPIRRSMPRQVPRGR